MNYLKIDAIEQLDTFNYEEKEITLNFNLPSYPLPIVKPLFERIKAIVEQNYKIEIIVETDGRNFNDEEIMAFTALEDNLKQIHVPLYFDGGYNDYYSLDELIKADVTLDKIISKYKNSSLSPLEKFFAIYLLLMKRQYKAEECEEENRHEMAYLSRDLISVVNGDYIVCAGYARLMEYLLENLGITCFKQTLLTEENHMNNLVYIEDDKYHVKGLYYADSCWDASCQTLSFCLLPLNDAAHMRCPLTIYTSSLPFYRVRNYKMLEDDDLLFSTTAMTEGSPDLIKKHHLDDKINHLYEISTKLFIKKRKSAIDRLITIFKEMNVEKDFYDMKGTFPYGTTLPFFVAMLMLSSDNEAIVRHQINEAKRFVELGVSNLSSEQRPYFNGDPMIRQTPLIPDVYEYLTKMKEYPYKTLDLSMASMFDRYSKYEEYGASLMEKIDFCLNTSLTIQRALALPILEDTVKKYPIGEPIWFDNFKDALTEAMKFEGDKTEEEINDTVETLLHDTTMMAQRCFDKDATNVFNKRAIFLYNEALGK